MRIGLSKLTTIKPYPFELGLLSLLPFWSCYVLKLALCFLRLLLNENYEVFGPQKKKTFIEIYQDGKELYFGLEQ